MSHISENTTSITTVNQAILQESIELVVKATPGMTVEKHFKNWGNTNEKCDLALFTPTMKRGIGIDFKQGGLKFRGDQYGVTEEYNRIMSLIKQTYYTVAAKKALQSLDHEVGNPIQLANGNFVVETA